MHSYKSMNYEELTDYDALYDSYLKCRRGVSWKPCVKSFDLNAPERVLKMSEELSDGTWKNRQPKPILIWYPKKREGLSIPFRDRIYQRSINDNVLYPQMSKSFIKENSACQIGKGTDHARNICKRNLRRMFINHGRDFYVGQIDIHHYYQTMPHDEVNRMFENALSEEEAYEAVRDVLSMQNNSEIGYNPGSQMIQIAGVSYLSPVDHFCKEVLRLKNYQRYMDDFLIFHESRKYCEYSISKTVDELQKRGFKVNPGKTHVMPVTEGFRFLGFDYRLTETGKVIMTVPSEKVEHERRKLRREVILWSKGRIPKSKIYEGLQSWESTHSAGDTGKMSMHMEQYLKGLFERYGKCSLKN